MTTEIFEPRPYLSPEALGEIAWQPPQLHLFTLAAREGCDVYHVANELITVADDGTQRHWRMDPPDLLLERWIVYVHSLALDPEERSIPEIPWYLGQDCGGVPMEVTTAAMREWASACSMLHTVRHAWAAATPDTRHAMRGYLHELRDLTADALHGRVERL